MITIVGGKFRGRKIEVPQSNTVRPTLNKTRAAIFNVLQHLVRIDEMDVLDLYAGSGALGLEALSRGAHQAVFVENSCNVFQILQKNINTFPLKEQQVTTLRRSAKQGLLSLAGGALPYLIFIDPPYHAQEYEKALPLISQLTTIPVHSHLVIESPRSLHYSIGPPLERITLKQYGKSKLDFLVKC